MQSAEAVQEFAQKYLYDLTISQNSDHAFMRDGDRSIVEKWLEKNITREDLLWVKQFFKKVK